VDPVAIMTRLILSVPLLPAYIARPMPYQPPQFSRPPFSAAHFPGHCFGRIPAPGTFTASAFPVPPLHRWVPSHKAAARSGSSSPRFGCPRKWSKKVGQCRRLQHLHYCRIASLGRNPEREQKPTFLEWKERCKNAGRAIPGCPTKIDGFLSCERGETVVS